VAHLAEDPGVAQAARPIITPSQPVSVNIRCASAGDWMFPLPRTGMPTACFTRAIQDQSGAAA